MILTAEEQERIGHLYWRAVDLVRQKGRVSYSDIQRRLHIGFFAADLCVKAMERNGVIGPADKFGHREILPEPDAGDVMYRSIHPDGI